MPVLAIAPCIGSVPVLRWCKQFFKTKAKTYFLSSRRRLWSLVSRTRLSLVRFVGEWLELLLASWVPSTRRVSHGRRETDVDCRWTSSTTDPVPHQPGWLHWPVDALSSSWTRALQSGRRSSGGCWRSSSDAAERRRPDAENAPQTALPSPPLTSTTLVRTPPTVSSTKKKRHLFYFCDIFLSDVIRVC